MSAIEGTSNELQVKDQRIPYFPYPEFKPSQKEIVATLLNKQSFDRSPVMIEAQTGSGKTIAVLSSLLFTKKPNQKIIVFVKTINQINSFLREWGMIFRSIYDGTSQNEKIINPLIMPLLGKNRVCAHSYTSSNKTILHCEEKKSISQNKLSKKIKKLSRRNHRYRLVKWINWKLIQNENPTVDNFTELLSSRENCPYYNSLTIIRDADIIVTTYGYFQPQNLARLLRYANVKIYDTLICIDEAHNLASEKFHTLSKFHLEIFLKLFSSNDFLKSFFDLIRGVRIIHLNEYFSQKEFSQGIKENLSKTNLAIQILKSEKAHSLNIPTKLLKDDYLFNGVKEIKIFLENLKFFKLDRDYLITSNKSILLPVLPLERILCTLKESNRLVLQSATFSPMAGFQRLLGLPESTKCLDLLERDIRKIRNRDNEFRSAYVSAVISSSRFRSKALFERFGSLIIKIYNVSPSHILVLSPSYEFNDELLKSIGRESVPIILEKSTSTTFDLQDKILNQNTKCIILGNQRGKILEGNEWLKNGKSVVSTVVLAGLATAIPRDEDPILYKIRLEKLRDHNLTRLFQNQIPLHIIAKQAIGRTIRSDKDRGALIILDARVDEFLQRNLWLYRYQVFSELLSDLNSFFNKYEKNDAQGGYSLC